MHFYKCKVGNAFDEWTCQNMETDGAGGTLDLQEQGREFVELSQEQREGASGGRDDLVSLTGRAGMCSWRAQKCQAERGRLLASLQVESSLCPWRCAGPGTMHLKIFK